MAKGVYDFLSSNFGWTFNFVFANVLFWAIGLPTYLEFGYTDSIANTFSKGDGQIQSGPSGSGVFPVSAALVVVCCFAYSIQIVSSKFSLFFSFYFNIIYSWCTYVFS